MVAGEEGVEPVAHEGVEVRAAGVVAAADMLAEEFVLFRAKLELGGPGGGVAAFGFGVEGVDVLKGDFGVEVAGGFGANGVGDDPGHKRGVAGDAGAVEGAEFFVLLAETAVVGGALGMVEEVVLFDGAVH